MIVSKLQLFTCNLIKDLPNWVYRINLIEEKFIELSTMELMQSSKSSKSAFLLKKSKSDLCNLNIGVKPTDSTHESEWRQIKSPSSKVNSRFHHSSVLCSSNVYIYGGYDNNNGILSDFKLFINDNSLNGKWVDLPVQNGPGPRHSHSAVIHNSTIYIFGGKVDRINSTNKVHAFSIQDNKWVSVQTKPQNQNQNNSISQIPKPTDSHQAIVIGNQMIVYGGFCNNQFTNNIHSLDLLTKKWRKIYPPSLNSFNENKTEQPEPRSDFSMVLYNQKLYIYAGKNLYRSFNDLWQFDLQTLKFKKVLTKKEPSQNRSGHSAAIYKQFMIIFGGISSVTHQRDDLLIYNFETHEWKTIWNNSQQKYEAYQQQKKKVVHKKLSNSKIKSMQNNSIINKYEINQKQQIRKYRRPLAEQKKINVRSQINFETDRSKKQKERKIMLINDIEATTMPYEHSYSTRYSPLIESLTNSIVLTSSIHNNSGNYRDHAHKHLTISQQNQNNKQGEKRIKARDGHTVHILQNEMMIFGGDRHMISINDIVFLNLGMLISNKDGIVSAQTCREETHEDDPSQTDESLELADIKQIEK